MRSKGFSAVLILLILVVRTPSVHASGNVDVCDEPHLLVALMGGGTVTFGCSGTITLTATLTIMADTTIDGGVQNITLSGNNEIRLFYVDSGVTLSLNNLTIANGYAAGDGGGVYNEGTVTVSNSTFSGNSANGDNSAGGGIFNAKTLIVSNSIFFENSANGISSTGGGGAIHNGDGTLIVSDSTFSGNYSGNYGGGINSSGTVTVSNSTFFSNNANSAGGGIYNYGGTLTLSNSSVVNNGRGGIFSGGTLTVNNCSISSNDATGIVSAWGTAAVSNSTVSSNFRSGIRNSGMMTLSDSSVSGNWTYLAGGGINNAGTLTVTHSTFSGNSAIGSESSGGGIFNSISGIIFVGNSTFANNSDGFYGGGGIYNAGALTVIHSTFSGNSTYFDRGGNIRNNGTLTLKNTIVANSPIVGNCYNFFGTINDGGGNLSYPDGTCPGIRGNPVLGPLQNNGGPTETMALGIGSAAIDAAVDATCADPPISRVDQRGFSRPQGEHCDIGAVEQFCPNFVPPATVGAEDVQAVAERWGWTISTPGWNAVYDQNLDNRIDVVDILMTAIAFGATCS